MKKNYIYACVEELIEKYNTSDPFELMDALDIYCESSNLEHLKGYQLTQFKKYYRDYITKTGATMHLDHKPGEVMQVDWAGDTASIIDTDTGERIPVYMFSWQRCRSAAIRM